ncbi:hypothetical protein [Microbacterium sp.]|uniref:hypothetical protein n=1 Tax=Microbacterium sp. TaxID=51671 RepID=UPI0039E5EE94
MDIYRLAGGILLIVGGIADTAQMVVGRFVSTPASPAVIVLITVGPTFLIAVGVLLLAPAVAGRARLGFVVAGVGALLLAVVNTVQIAAGSPLGPAPSQLASLLSLAALTAGAALVFWSDSTGDPLRWTLALPAIAAVLVLVSLFVFPWDGAHLLVPVAYAVSGALLLRPASRAQRSLPAH